MLGYLFCTSVAINEISVVAWALLISVLCTAGGLEDNPSTSGGELREQDTWVGRDIKA